MQTIGEAAKTAKQENPHSQHRQRVKARFYHEGLDHFATHEVIEMLLFFGIPQGDTNELAHELLNRFGSLTRLLEASVDELKRIKGIGDHVATLICFCGEMSRLYYKEKCDIGSVFSNIHEAGRYIMPKFFGRKKEAVVLLSLDSRRKALNCTVVFEGSVNATEINIRLVLQQALQDNATAVILAHNHPNGYAIPSEEDIQSTQKLVHALAIADVRVLDHLIFADDDFLSMAQTPALQYLFER